MTVRAVAWNHTEAERKEVIKVDDETTPILHADVLRAVSKEGHPYECIEFECCGLLVFPLFPMPAGVPFHVGHSKGTLFRCPLHYT